MKTKEDILNAISQDHWMMNILYTAKELQLQDWCVCAGFVRSKVWDEIHGYSVRTPLPDVDVIYYNDKNLAVDAEKELEHKLYSIHPSVPWSVKNQARMHLKNNSEPYKSSKDAISKFPETATAVGVKLDDANNLILIAPLGIEDLINCRVRPTPTFNNTDKMHMFNNRVKNKRWHDKWRRVNYN
mgnify:CR=1 FL=1